MKKMTKLQNSLIHKACQLSGLTESQVIEFYTINQISEESTALHVGNILKNLGKLINDFKSNKSPTNHNIVLVIIPDSMATAMFSELAI